MLNWLNHSREDLRLIFEQTAHKKGIASPAIIEKDFWVCVVLHTLFSLEPRPRLIFKGGTSLSKAYNLIERFSEDIDLGIHWQDLGFVEGRDPKVVESKNAREKLLKELADEINRYVKSSLLSKLELRLHMELPYQDWRLVYDFDNGPILQFVYPQVLQSSLYPKFTYLRPVVKIEIGARSAHEPFTEKLIIPYCTEAFPHLFDDAPILVQVLLERRTFWEKVTIAHAEYHRPEHKATPERLARHYYDIYKILQSPQCASVHSDLDLLNDVVRHKQEFYRCGWAQYEKACPGSLRIVPHNRLRKLLAKDYREMREMIFGPVPEFEDMMQHLKDTEREINSM